MHQLRLRLTLVLLLAGSLLLRAQDQPAAPTPAALLGEALQKLAALVEPMPGAAPQTVSATLRVSRGDGVPGSLQGRSLDFAWQAPDRLRLAAKIGDDSLLAGRDRAALWVQIGRAHV